MSGNKRRGSGEGSIYHRADGRWATSATIGFGPRMGCTTTAEPPILYLGIQRSKPKYKGREPKDFKPQVMK